MDKKVTSKDFLKLAKENEFFFWHFMIDNQSLELHSYYTADAEICSKINKLKFFVDEYNLPYFESNMKDEIDFITDLNPEFLNHAWNKEHKKFSPVILGFHRKRLIETTWTTCYCLEGFLQLVLKVNPNFIINQN